MCFKGGNTGKTVTTLEGKSGRDADRLMIGGWNCTGDGLFGK